MGERRFTRQVPTATGAASESEERSVDGDTVFDVTEAIGSKPRWKLLTAVAEQPHTIDDLVDRLDRSKGTISVHISKLEEAGVVRSGYTVSDQGGVKKVVSIAVDEITLDLDSLAP